MIEKTRDQTIDRGLSELRDRYILMKTIEIMPSGIIGPQKQLKSELIWSGDSVLICRTQSSYGTGASLFILIPLPLLLFSNTPY